MVSKLISFSTWVCRRAAPPAASDGLDLVELASRGFAIEPGEKARHGHAVALVRGAAPAISALFLRALGRMHGSVASEMSWRCRLSRWRNQCEPRWYRRGGRGLWLLRARRCAPRSSAGSSQAGDPAQVLANLGATACVVDEELGPCRARAGWRRRATSGYAGTSRAADIEQPGDRVGQRQ